MVVMMVVMIVMIRVMMNAYTEKQQVTHSRTALGKQTMAIYGYLWLTMAIYGYLWLPRLSVN